MANFPAIMLSPGSQSASGAKITSSGILLKGRRQRQKENTGVRIRSSSFVLIWRGSAGDAARPIPQRSEVGSVGRRLHGRDGTDRVVVAAFAAITGAELFAAAVAYGATLGLSLSVPDEFRELAEKDL